MEPHLRFIVSVILISAGSLAGCGRSKAPDDQPVGDRTPALQEKPSDDPAALKEYFPMKSGTRWVYSLKKGEVPPNNHWEIFWPGEGQRLRQWVDQSGTTDGRLVLRIKGETLPPKLAEGQKYVTGVEVEVEEDAPGRYQLFADFEAIQAGKSPFMKSRVYWGVYDKPFGIDEVQVFDATYAPPGATAGAEGRQTQTLMFSPFFGSVEELGAKVWLLSAPRDEAVPGFEGQPCLHFLRKFGSQEDPSMTEDVWFAKGKGLVRLVQKMQGKVSLTMELTEFTP